jgi:hypothetical protein
VAATLLDALVRILCLDFATFERAILTMNWQEWLVSAEAANEKSQTKEVGRILTAYLNSHQSGASVRIDNPLGIGKSRACGQKRSIRTTACA